MRLSKKILSVLCITLLTASTSAYAATVPSGDISSAKKTLTNYLEAVKNKDVKSLVDLSDDIRVGSDQDHAQLLEKIFQNKDETVKSYSIGNYCKVNDLTSNFTAQINYSNNKVDTINLNVTKKNNKFVVVVGQDVNDSGKIIDSNKNYNATVINYSKEDYLYGNLKGTVGQRLTSWTRYMSDSNFRKCYTYNINSCASSVFVNVKQYSGTPHAEVQYAIVTEHWYGDNVHASAMCYENSESEAQKIYMSPGSQTNVSLRMKDSSDVMGGDGKSYTMTTIGEIYNYYY